MYTDELFLACRAQAMNTVEDHLHASVLVVSDITDIPEMLAWSAILGGKFICESKYVVTRGEKGLSIKYTAAASVRRRVHITSEFLRCNEEASCVLLFYSSGKAFVPAGSPAPGRWTLIESFAEFLEIANGAIRRKRPTEVIAFCQDADKDGADLQRLKLVFPRLRLWRVLL